MCATRTSSGSSPVSTTSCRSSSMPPRLETRRGTPRDAGTWPMADSSVWRRLKKRPLESYNKTWLGFIAVAVVAVVIGAMLVVHMLGVGYRHYTAEFLQAASLRAGNPITIAGIPVGTVTSMKLDGDHVEAGLKIRDDIALGKDSKASIKVTTILGSRYLAIE